MVVSKMRSLVCVPTAAGCQILFSALNALLGLSYADRDIALHITCVIDDAPQISKLCHPSNAAVNYTPQNIHQCRSENCTSLHVKRFTTQAGQLSRYSDWLRAGRSGDRIPVGARFSALVQTGPGAHPASCIMGTGSFPGVESGRGVTLTPHPLLVPRSKNRVQLYLYCP
jgi:hypothetical protein